MRTITTWQLSLNKKANVLLYFSVDSCYTLFTSVKLDFKPYLFVHVPVKTFLPHVLIQPLKTRGVLCHWNHRLFIEPPSPHDYWSTFFWSDYFWSKIWTFEPDFYPKLHLKFLVVHIKDDVVLICRRKIGITRKMLIDGYCPFDGEIGKTGRLRLLWYNNEERVRRTWFDQCQNPMLTRASFVHQGNVQMDLYRVK